MNRSLKFTLLTITMGIILMVMGSIVMAQETPPLFQKQPEECSDPTFLDPVFLPTGESLGNSVAALLQEILMRGEVDVMYLVYNEKGGIALVSGHVDLIAVVVQEMDWTIKDVQWDVPIKILDTPPSLIQPKTTLSWDKVQVEVVLCGKAFKYRLSVVTENPGSEVTATPEATATPQS